jgi:hypothetical protein
MRGVVFVSDSAWQGAGRRKWLWASWNNLSHWGETRLALTTVDGIISNLELFRSRYLISIHILHCESELGGEINS